MLSPVNPLDYVKKKKRLASLTWKFLQKIRPGYKATRVTNNPTNIAPTMSFFAVSVHKVTPQILSYFFLKPG